MDVKTLIDNAVGLPYGSRVNFYVLNALLKCFAIKLQMSNDDISLYLGAETSLKIKNRLKGGADEGIEETQEENKEPPVPDETENVEPKPPEVVAEETEQVQPAEIIDTEENPEEEKAPEVPASEAPPSEAEASEAPDSEAALLEIEEEQEGSSSAVMSENEEEVKESSHKSLEPLVPHLDMDFQFSEITLADETGKQKRAPKISFSKGNYAKKKDFDRLKRELDEMNIQGIADNYNFMLHGILTLIKTTVNKTWDPNDIRRLSYLQSKLSGHAVDLSSSEINIPLPKEKKRESIYKEGDAKAPAKSYLNYITRNELEHHEVITEIKNNEKLMFLKVDALSVRFLQRNFEEEYEKLHEVAERGKKFITEFKAAEARIAKNSERLNTLEKTCSELIKECSRLDERKIDATQIKETIDLKPDFKHLNKKLSVIDFIQYKCVLDSDLGFICEALEDLIENVKVVKKIGRILEKIEKAEWVDELKADVKHKINDLREEIMEVIQSNQPKNNYGLPLLGTLPRSLKTKVETSFDKSQTKKYFTPSLHEIETCLKNLSRGDKPLIMPSKNFLIRGTTRVKRSPSEPANFRLCGEKVEINLPHLN